MRVKRNNNGWCRTLGILLVLLTFLNGPVIRGQVVGVSIEISGKDLVCLNKVIRLEVAEIDGATYKWSITRGADKVEFIGDPKKKEVDVKGIKISGAMKDVTIKVEVWKNGAKLGEDTHDLTVFKVEIEKPQFGEKKYYAKGGDHTRVQMKIEMSAKIQPDKGELKNRLKDKLKWSIDEIDDSHTTPSEGNVKMKWSPALDATHGKGLKTAVTFTGLPPRNSDFGWKGVTLEVVDHDCDPKGTTVRVFFHPLIVMAGTKVKAWYHYFSADGRDGDPGVNTFTRTDASLATHADYGGKKDVVGWYDPTGNKVTLYDDSIKDVTVRWNGGGVALDYRVYSGDGVEHTYWHENWHRWIQSNLVVHATLLKGQIDPEDTKISVLTTRDFPATGTIYIADDAITYNGKTGTQFRNVPAAGANGINAVHVAQSLVTSRQDRAGEDWDWNDGTGGARDPDRDGAKNQVDPDNDNDRLPDQFELMLSNIHGLSFDVNDRWTNAYNGFPISFRPGTLGGDEEVFVEWRLAGSRVPDLTDATDWPGDIGKPDEAPNRNNDWSVNGFKWMN